MSSTKAAKSAKPRAKKATKRTPKPTKKASKAAYAEAGVDLELGNRVKSGIGSRIKSTHRPEVLGAIGGFGGLFDAKFKKYKHPVLVSSIDGVGTKLKVASMMNQHDTIGSDLVNHCVNDIAVLGAEPLFFLDYLGTSSLDPKSFNQILKGLADACAKSNCALIGGETAQMPGLYHGDDYDLVGTIIGVVEKKKMIDGSKIKAGDVVVGFPSSGLHTNGYSLARTVFFQKLKMSVNDTIPSTKQTLGEALLATHVNYQPLLKKLSKKVTFKGLAHITGGGFVDNIPRVLPERCDVEIQTGTWKMPPIFRILQEKSGISQEELYHVFNMGIGMVAIVSSKDAVKILDATKAWIIGTVLPGRKKTRLKF
ncbi:MAG: phosphoribosylformylglycinamidine cyclo-ligase [Verrucomicrobiota bacterium]